MAPANTASLNLKRPRPPCVREGTGGGHAVRMRAKEKRRSPGNPLGIGAEKKTPPQARPYFRTRIPACLGIEGVGGNHV